MKLRAESNRNLELFSVAEREALPAELYPHTGMTLSLPCEAQKRRNPPREILGNHR
jgi:hypothetical protein